MAAHNELIAAVILLLVTVIFYTAALAIEDDPFSVGLQPYVFPKVICIGLGRKILLHLAGCLRRISSATTNAAAGNDETVDGAQGELKVFVVWVLPMAIIAFAYIGALQLVQYPLATMLGLSATLALSGNRGVKRLAIFPVLFATLSYFVFSGLFRLFEPHGAWLEYDNYYLLDRCENSLDYESVGANSPRADLSILIA
jgi:hypothetical protein